MRSLLLVLGFVALSYCALTIGPAPTGGGGFVTGILNHPTSDRTYFRTDVGGVYVFNATTNRWKVLTRLIFF